jgi:predicted DNA-binding protein (MmcQ/YjbR family)
MTTLDPFQSANAALRTFALKYPEAWEDFLWGHSAYKVKSKIFLSISQHEPEVMCLTVKLPISHEVAVALPFAEPARYGLGKNGWVTARFGPDDAIPLHMLMEWIDESYRAVAPKKLVAVLDAAEENTMPAVPPKK